MTAHLLILFSLCHPRPLCAQGAPTGSPLELIDLRWLARGQADERFVIDTFTRKAPAPEARIEQIVAEVNGPAVLDYFMGRSLGELEILADGIVILKCTPSREWKQVYVPPEPREYGELPFAFPLVQEAGPYSQCVVPIPFSNRLVVKSSESNPKIWLSGRRLKSASKVHFSIDLKSDYIRHLARAQAELLGEADHLVEYPNESLVKVESSCAVGKTTRLAVLTGPAEMVGLRLQFEPAAMELLRHQVIELKIDGVSSVRMPLVDFIGVSHPWPHAWFPMAGTWAAGLMNPVARMTKKDPAIYIYFRLPVPFRKTLAIDIVNRSATLPCVFRGELAVVPLSEAEQPWRLCGTSRRVPLVASTPSDSPHLFQWRQRGHLAGISFFATGQGLDWNWRSKVRFQLTDKGRDYLSPGLLPFAFEGISGNIQFESTTWNHNTMERTMRLGAGRHFWRDPLPFDAGASLTFTNAEGGPTRAEVGLLWYEPSEDAPFEAPVIPHEVERLPAMLHGQGRLNEGSSLLEAESLAGAAVASNGRATAESNGALDAFSSGDAYLAWNAGRVGETLDIFAKFPKSQYVRLWYHRLMFLNGGVFNINLLPTDTQAQTHRIAQSDEDFRSRVLGQSQSESSITCYDNWPHRQAYRFLMPIVINPSPGQLGRIRFTCATKPPGSRGYMLAIDQLGLESAPTTPPGWFDFESTIARPDRIREMQAGRPDFYGWGGLELSHTQPNQPDLEVGLHRITAAKASSTVIVRGLIQSGSWRAQVVDSSDLIELVQAQTDVPTEWRFALRQPVTGPLEVKLVLCCTSDKGMILLDAWRTGE